MTSLNIAARLTETITMKRQTGHSSAGDPTYKAATTMKARVERGGTEAADGEGRRINDASDIYTTTALLLGDIVWFPEDDTADTQKSRRVVGVMMLRALDGSITHYESRVA